MRVETTTDLRAITGGVKPSDLLLERKPRAHYCYYRRQDN